MTDKGSFLEYVRVSFLGFAVIFSIAAKAGDDPAPAQTEKPQQRAAEVNAKQAVGEDEIDGPTILEGVPGLNWLDDLRDRLRDDRGVYFHGSYIGDPYANLAGGLRRGATYSGRLDAELDIDAGKLLGIPGGALHANVYQIHGVDLSQNFIGNFSRPTTSRRCRQRGFTNFGTSRNSATSSPFAQVRSALTSNF